MSDAIDKNQQARLMPVHHGEPVENYEELVRTRLQDDPLNGRLWLLLGSHLRIKERFDDSERCLRKALKLTPFGDSRVLVELALLYRTSGRNDDANRIWRVLRRIQNRSSLDDW